MTWRSDYLMSLWPSAQQTGLIFGCDTPYLMQPGISRPLFVTFWISNMVSLGHRPVGNHQAHVVSASRNGLHIQGAVLGFVFFRELEGFSERGQAGARAHAHDGHVAVFVEHLEAGWHTHKCV